MFNQVGVRVMILTTTSMFGRRLAETSPVAPRTAGTA
jgi:hypothetical protein